MIAHNSVRLEELFHAAADLPHAERAEFLEAACDSDAELLQILRSLLDADSDPASLPNVILNDACAAGTQIGSYRIVRELGSGGMGTVYLAERADGQFRQQAALKVINFGFSDEGITRRFLRERQILARLDHPAIARLFDGGVTSGGRPWFVLEYVDGVRIDRFCKDRARTIRERLALFLQVCGAVQYAHQNLTIHRDIKPGNILVTSSGQVKLLDFGIAKILADQDEFDADRQTKTGLALTLGYASPEQARGEPVGTRTDIYSLGTLLYELLAGKHPLGTAKVSLPETARRLQETEPARPSEAAVDPDRQILRGDLDRIVLLAMQKDPARRYPSVEAFAADIQRWLDGFPVSARGDSYRYRAGKFVRRNRTLATAAALLVLTVAGSVASLVHSAAATERQRARAERRFGEIREVARALIFDIDPVLQGIPGTTSVRKLINDRALTYLDRLSADASGDAALQRELANGYIRLGMVQGMSGMANLGDMAGARSSFDKALRILSASLAADPDNTDGVIQRVQTLDALGQVELMSGGDPAVALPPHRQALQEIDALLTRTAHPSGKMLNAAAGANLNLAENYAGNMDYANLGDPYRAVPLLARAGELYAKASSVLMSEPNPASRRAYRFYNQAVNELVLSGVYLLQLRQPAEASKHIERAIDLLHSPGNDINVAEVRRLLGLVEGFRTRILLEQGYAAAALASNAMVQRTADELLRADPVNQALLADHILAAIQGGQAEAAAGHTATGTGPITGMRRIDSALQENERLVNDSAPEYLRALLATNYLIAGNAELASGHTDAALRRFAHAAEVAGGSMKRHPSDAKAKFDFASAQLGLARCHAGQSAAVAQHKALAAAADRQVLELHPDNPKAQEIFAAASAQ